MNYLGNEFGRFFWSIITVDYFIGLAWRIGIEDTECGTVFHSSLTIGSFQFTIGWILKGEA